MKAVRIKRLRRRNIRRRLSGSLSRKNLPTDNRPTGTNEGTANDGREPENVAEEIPRNQSNCEGEINLEHSRISISGLGIIEKGGILLKSLSSGNEEKFSVEDINAENEDSDRS